MSLIRNSVLAGIVLATAMACAPQQSYTPAPAGASQAVIQPQAGEEQRQVSFNGRAATEQDWEIIRALERQYGQRLPAGAYWYDPRTGASGMWGGPTVGFVTAGLELGGPLPPNASGGGSGMLTGVFINGREIHPQDQAALMEMLGQVVPGRWSVDAYGNAGPEGGPPAFNIFAVAQQRQAASGGKSSIYRTDGKGNNVFVGSKCVAVNASKQGEDGVTRSASYYSGCD